MFWKIFKFGMRVLLGQPTVVHIATTVNGITQYNHVRI